MFETITRLHFYLFIFSSPRTSYRRFDEDREEFSRTLVKRLTSGLLNVKTLSRRSKYIDREATRIIKGDVIC